MIDFSIPPPSQTQYRFLTDTHKYVGFGGARGGGKSWAVRVKAIIMGLSHPGIKQTIIRRTYPELQENHIKPIRLMLPGELYTYNESKKELTFINGSVLLFRYCSSDKDLMNFQGTEMDILYIDEATHFTEEQFKILNACVRGVNSFPKRIYLTCNPGGPGHSWVKRLFIDRNFREGENPEDYSFIHSKVTDNKALLQNDPEYISQLEALPERKRKAWLEGDWNVLEGQFFEEFTDDPAHYDDGRFTHVINPFAIPPEWKIYRSMDWGYNKPFSIGWWAVDYDGVLYRILEYYGCRQDAANEGLHLQPAAVFKRVKELENEHPWLKGKTIIGVADPACWGTQTGESVAETAAKAGVYFRPGDNARIPGWMQIHYRLDFDENGYPMMYVFKNCYAFIRTIATLVYDEHKVEDLDTNGEDHVLDEVRYMCMTRPIKPRVKEPENRYYENPLYQFLDIEQQDLGRIPGHRRMEVIKEAEDDFS